MSDYKETSNEIVESKIAQELATLPSYVSSFIVHKKFSTSPKTRLEYVRDIRLFLEYVCQSCEQHSCINPMDVTLEILDGLDLEFLEYYPVYLSLYEKNGVKRKNSNVSIRRKLSSLRGFFSYLFLSDKISKDLTVKLEIPSIEKKNIIRLDKEESMRYLNTIVSGKGNLSEQSILYNKIQRQRDFTIVSLLLGTGMRISECVGLDIDDLDLPHHCMKINRKGGKEDILYLSDDVTALLEEYLDYRNTLTANPDSENALFLSSQKNRIGVRTVEIMVKKYKHKSGILKNITPHKFRSTYGTALYQATSDLYLVSSVLGHNSVQTTKDFYTDMDLSYKQARRNALSSKTEEQNDI